MRVSTHVVTEISLVSISTSEYSLVISLTYNIVTHRCSLPYGPYDPILVSIINDKCMVRNYHSLPMASWLTRVSTVFGDIHWVAWDHHFTSGLERRLWRRAALVTKLGPMPLPIMSQGASSFQRRLKLTCNSIGALWFMVFSRPLSFLGQCYWPVCC